MKTLLIASLFLIVCTNNLIAQAPDIEWQNSLGGTDGDRLRCVEQTSDGGFILGGFSRSNASEDKVEDSHGLGDYWIIKLNAEGNILWQNTLGGTTGDQVYEIEQTTDGGYIVGGYSYSNICEDKSEDNKGVNAKDYWVVKLNDVGDIEWENTIGGVGEDFLWSTKQTSDGGYIVGGYSHSKISGDKIETTIGGDDYDFWILKLDDAGEIVWQNDIGGNGDDELYTIIQTADGGYIAGGESTSGISGDKSEASYGEADFWVVKLFENGTVEWEKTIGGSGDDELKSIVQTDDGGYILGGTSDSDISGNKTENSKGDEDIWIVKIDALGNILWQKTIGGNKEDGLSHVEQTNDNNFIIAGHSKSGNSGDISEINNGSDDFWILKIDANGNLLWQKTIGGNGSDIPYWIMQCADGGYILGGDSASELSGDKNEPNQGVCDYWVIKLAPEIPLDIATIKKPAFDVYPNPSNNSIHFEITTAQNYQLTILDPTGKIMQFYPSITSEQQISVEDLIPGMYFLQLQTENYSLISKFIKL